MAPIAPSAAHAQQARWQKLLWIPQALSSVELKALPAESSENIGQGTESVGVRRRRFLVATLILFASLALRLIALHVWGKGAIESEGAEYARIAQNIRHGMGYVGIVTPGPELMFPPLFPLFIAAASFITRDYAHAGRLVALVFGTLLPLPAFGIAARLFNRRVGFLAAGLFILHPLFINLSFTVLTEGPYATLLLSAIYVVLWAFDSCSTRSWCLVGAAFGAAYLLRPEAVAPLAIAAFFAMIATEGSLFTRCKHAGAAILVFLVFATPEIAFIYQKTGNLRLQAKTAITLPLAILVLDKEAGTTGVPAMQHVEAMKWASSAIDGDMRRLGIWLRPEVEVVRDMPVSRKDLVRVMTAAIRQNTPVLLETLSSKWIGAPFITALAFLGIFHRPWGRSVAVGRLYLFLVPATAILASFSVLWPFSRYYFVLVPFLLIWASNGLLELKQWIRSSFAASPWAWLRTGLWPWVIPGLLGFGVLIYPMRAIGSLYEFTEGSRESRVVEETGIWIGRQQNVPVTIMDRYTPLAFYADAQFVYFPYCSGDLALRFLDASQVDYVILRRNERFTPYYEDWLAKGVPDSRAELVYTSPGPDAGKIVVYRWHREYSRPPALPTPSGGEPH